MKTGQIKFNENPKHLGLIQREAFYSQNISIQNYSDKTYLSYRILVIDNNFQTTLFNSNHFK